MKASKVLIGLGGLLVMASFCLPISQAASKKIIPKKAKSKIHDKGVKKLLLSKYIKNLTQKELAALKKETISFAGKSVPALIEVMKSAKYPDRNRWVATFLLGKIVGKRSAPFISKFLRHPNWVMRMASLKTLLGLKQKKFSSDFAFALKDKSLLVRRQALDNIQKMELGKHSSDVWKMLFDERNYHVKKSGNKRSHIIKKVITTIGDLKFEKAKTPLLSMVQKKKYQDIFTEIDYSLGKITGKKSPDGEKHVKQRYWKKVALANKTF
jgi:hypothetical protein